MSKNHLGNNIFYRLAKVIYICCWILLIFITFGFFILIKPSGNLLKDKSTLLCNGQVISLSNLSGNYSRNFTDLDESDKKLVNNSECGFLNTTELNNEKNFDVEAARNAGYTNIEINEHLNSTIKSYKFHPKYDDEYAAEWIKAGIKTLIFLVISAFILNLLKNVLLYIITGRRFSVIQIN